MNKGERIAKVIARSGLCSRRDAERWISEGRIQVDGVVIQSPALCVTPLMSILVEGTPLPSPEAPRVWLYHKPRGLVTTHKDEKGRATVFSALPKDLPRVISVGRLDLNSEGLLLLTNDGALARYLELPATGWVRRYRIRVYGKVEIAALADLKKGVTLEGIHYGPITATLDRQQGGNGWITVTLREGKNRELRRIFDWLNWPINRLIRLSYGPFQLGSLSQGALKEVPQKMLSECLGKNFSLSSSQ